MTIIVATGFITLLAFAGWWYRAWDAANNDADEAASVRLTELILTIEKLRDAVATLTNQSHLADTWAADRVSANFAQLRADLNVLHNDLEHIDIHLPEMPSQTLRLP